MNTTKEKMEVMQAFLDGKTIQTIPRVSPTGTEWRVIAVGEGLEPAWNWFASDYRVKPEPRVIWVNEYASEQAVVHDSKEMAEEDAADYAVRVAVKYREVIGEE